MAFLVGKPEYLANSPIPDATPILSEVGDRALLEDVKAALASHIASNPSQRWGILEACQRISVVRSASEARTRAIQQRPMPPRDSETVRAQRSAESQAFTESLVEALGEERQ
jgi:hypothetical protein